MKINFKQQYDNSSAHQVIKSMMVRHEKINIEFTTDGEGIPCVWVESYNTRKILYLLNMKSIEWIIGYLEQGVQEDFGINPTDVYPYKGEDFIFDTLQNLISSGHKLLFIPRFRENRKDVFAILPLIKGKIFFRIRRTKEMTEYLEKMKIPA